MIKTLAPIGLTMLLAFSLPAHAQDEVVCVGYKHTNGKPDTAVHVRLNIKAQKLTINNHLHHVDYYMANKERLIAYTAPKNNHSYAFDAITDNYVLIKYQVKPERLLHSFPVACHIEKVKLSNQYKT